MGVEALADEVTKRDFEALGSGAQLSERIVRRRSSADVDDELRRVDERKVRFNAMTKLEPTPFVPCERRVSRDDGVGDIGIFARRVLPHDQVVPVDSRRQQSFQACPERAAHSASRNSWTAAHG